MVKIVKFKYFSASDNCYLIVKRKTKKTFACDQCDYSSNNSDILKCHVETIHIAKRYQCALCQFAIYEKDKLLEHIKAQHSCDECKQAGEADEKTLGSCEQERKGESSCIHRELSTLYTGSLIKEGGNRGRGNH